jgi:hypothetical protein
MTASLDVAMKSRHAMSAVDDIKPLLFHPSPEEGETILEWIKKLAPSNNVDNRMMYWYLTGLSKKHGFIRTLHELTLVPLARIEKMENEFRDEYWKNGKRCPLKECGYTAKRSSTMMRHLNLKHGL